jgi:hypothetical protein
VPSGGLTPVVPFTVPSVITPGRDMFLNGRRNPYRVRPYAPFIGGYGGYLPPVSDTDLATAAVPPVPVATGQLRVTGAPGDAQVYVDGYYVGTVADAEAARPLSLDAGPHRLELRAEGFQPLSVDIRISPNDTLNYRASLDRLQPSAPVRPAALSAAPMYLIPNCYLGNVPPRQNRLPSGCDAKQVQVLGAK